MNYFSIQQESVAFHCYQQTPGISQHYILQFTQHSAYHTSQGHMQGHVPKWTHDKTERANESTMSRVHQSCEEGALLICNACLVLVVGKAPLSSTSACLACVADGVQAYHHLWLSATTAAVQSWIGLGVRNCGL